MEALLRSSLAAQAASVDPPDSAWAENTHRVRRDTRRRTAVAAVAVVAASTVGVLGFDYLHEPGRGQTVPVQPLGTQRPAP